MTWEAQRTSFGSVAASYDAHRPDWPAATAAWLTGTEPPVGTEPAGTAPPVGTEPGGPNAGRQLDVLDLGAGTGKLTSTLVTAGHRVTAIDPSEGMLAVLADALPEVRTVIGSAEQLPFGDAEFDVVTVAQAWHWVDHEAAAAECARVLRPGGQLAIAWHLRSLEAESWVDELEALTGTPEYQGQESVRQRTGLALPEPFGEVEHTTFEYGLELTPQTLAAVAATWSYVATREDRDKVLVQVEALGRRVADENGRLVMPHITYCHRARR